MANKTLEIEKAGIDKSQPMVEKVEGTSPAPLSAEAGGEEREEQVLQEEQLEVAKTGKIPLDPAVIRLPASILGRVGTELTGYPGFTFTEGELNDLANLWVKTGVEMGAMTQAAIGSTAMIAGKFGGYAAWVKAGRPKVAGAAAIGQETAEGEGSEV